MKTMQEKFAAALEARGEEKIPHKSAGRYWTYTRLGTSKFFFLGRAGALRTGSTVRGSIPVSAKFKELLLQEATH